MRAVGGHCLSPAVHTYFKRHRENPDGSAQPLINQSVAPGYAGDNAAALSLSSLTHVRSCWDLHKYVKEWCCCKARITLPGDIPVTNRAKATATLKSPSILYTL